MNLHRYLSAAQVAECEAISKSLEELKKISGYAAYPTLSAMTLDPAHYNRVFNQ